MSEHVLDERARRLAAPLVDDAAAAARSFIGFVLAGNRYAVDVRDVVRVARLTEWVPVPDAPDAFLGLASLHGEMLALADLPRLLGGLPHPDADLLWVVVLGDENGMLGLPAEEVVSVEEALDATRTLPGHLAACGVVEGVTESMWVVLRTRALLEHPRLGAGEER